MAIVNFKKLSNFLSEKTTEILIFSLICGLTWLIAKEEALPPNGRFFVVLGIFAAAYVGGELCILLNVPPILGMLAGGCILRNSSSILLSGALSSIVRYFSLATILLRAGLGLDLDELRKLSGLCVRLAFAPCLVEVMITAATGYIFYNMPIVWGLLMGFVLSAVSPAIVVQQMLTLKEQNLGIDKGIPTLVIAAASVDDIIAITGFGVLTSIALADSTSFARDLLKAPVEAFCGIGLGIIVGLLISLFPSSYGADLATLVKEERQRIALTILFGTFLILYTRDLEMGAVGALASLTLTIVSSITWRRRLNHIAVEDSLKVIWNLIEPLLFGLIGAEVQLSILRIQTVILSIITLSIGLTMRCLTVIAVLYGGNFNMKEKIFVSFAWLPKATVQAALGPIALDTARDLEHEEFIKYGTLVLTIAVMSIFITAPLGSLAISTTAPRLLNESSASTTVDESVDE